MLNSVRSIIKMHITVDFHCALLIIGDRTIPIIIHSFKHNRIVIVFETAILPYLYFFFIYEYVISIEFLSLSLSLLL